VYLRREFDDQDVGLLALLPSPYNRDKWILLAAGLKVTGTQAALLALCDYLCKPPSNRSMKKDGETVEVPVLLVRANPVSEVNGLGVAEGYQLI
jgi:hypothetical protein